MEPNLAATLETADQIGHIILTVALTPDHLSETHKFISQIDQSYLLSIIRECKHILERFPLREQHELPKDY